MATFTAIQNKKQALSVMLDVLSYVAQEKKTRWGDARLVTGHNCVPKSSFIEMQTTKNRFRKTDGRLFYHFVQSFSADDDVTPQEVNAIGLEFAQRQFPDFEVVIATHVDTNHLHNHLVVNSVSCKDGHKLHQSPDERDDPAILAASGPAQTGPALVQLTVVETQLTAGLHVCRTSSSQSPLNSVSGCRRKLRSLPCSSSPHWNRSAGFQRGPPLYMPNHLKAF